MSCYELRLGNYVLVNKNLLKISGITPTTVSTIDANEQSEQIVLQHNLSDIQPVPLTDDVLKQCGFAYHDYFKIWQLRTTGPKSELDIDRDYNVIDFMRKPLVSKLTSLHQLQNSYFMMKGEELEFSPAVSVVA